MLGRQHLRCAQMPFCIGFNSRAFFASTKSVKRMSKYQ